MASDPGAPAAACAIHNSSASALPVTHHNGTPSPMASNASASASAGMMTKVVSGIATMLASAPYSPALWKWYSAIGASAASTTAPVKSNDAISRAAYRHQFSSRL